MKSTADLFLNILKKNPKESILYFNQIALGDEVEPRFGFVDDHVSLTFKIVGEKKLQKLCISKKLNILLKDVYDNEILNSYLETVIEPTRFHFCPYLEIEPSIYVFRIGIAHKQ